IMEPVPVRNPSESCILSQNVCCMLLCKRHEPLTLVKLTGQFLSQLQPLLPRIVLLRLSTLEMNHYCLRSHVLLPYSRKIHDAYNLFSSSLPRIGYLVMATHYATNTPSPLKLESQEKVIPRNGPSQLKYSVFLRIITPSLSTSISTHPHPRTRL